MTVQEIQKSVDILEEEDKFLLLAYLKHSLRADSEANRQQLSRLHGEIEAGSRVDLAKARRLHEALAAEGL